MADTPSPVPDLEAYLARIRYTGSREPTLATLRALHWHHVLAIPFENLDVLLERPIALDLPSVEHKLVHHHRGGYCYEQNTLFGAVLRRLGFQVTDLIARVRWQIPPDRGTPRSHMILRVDVEGGTWITDVGFGSIGLSAPLKWETDVEQSTPHEPRRLIRRGEYLVHQVRIGAEWNDVFQFTPDPVPPVDYEVANWFTSRNPRSHFLANLIVTRVRPDGRVLLFNREFTQRRNDGSIDKREVTSADEILTLLSTHFDLHFPAGTRFSRPNAIWPV